MSEENSFVDDVYFLIQSTILFGGALFAWSSVYRDFLNFFGSTADIPEACLSGQTVLSVCFAGATVFLTAFVWSLFIYRSKRGGIWCAGMQRGLSWMLGLASVGAWGFTGLHATGVVAWANTNGCLIEGMHIPTENPCFYGATFFTVSFLWALLVISHEHRGKKE
ncbi:MAG: hypothetical protein HGA67_04200 [Candidatus Yonathbacteria bacterium]|nr:hypothetical protein [Candidatus Yonathbacteria bacterium]